MSDTRRTSCPHDYVIVTYTRRLRDLFRKRYWLNCTECWKDRVDGPYASPHRAHGLATERWMASVNRTLSAADQPLSDGGDSP